MSAELPPIPDEAVAALLRSWSPFEDEGWDEGDVILARRDLTAAWPHAGAAWLRWAADWLAGRGDIRALAGQVGQERPWTEGRDSGLMLASSRLRALADEVEGK